jgi:hypothetical protein
MAHTGAVAQENAAGGVLKAAQQALRSEIGDCAVRVAADIYSRRTWFSIPPRMGG